MTKAERNGERREEGMERRGQEGMGRRVGNNRKRKEWGAESIELSKEGRKEGIRKIC
jgi:hypothetical protein